MDIYRSLAGCIRVELTSADINRTIGEMNAAGIVIGDIETVDYLTIRFTVSRRHLKYIRSLAKRNGESVSILRRIGLFWTIRNLLNRPVFLFGLIFILSMSFFIPSRILFVEVEGNAKIPEKQIIEAVKIAGVGFGTVRRGIRNEKVKNILLDTLPQLQWAGVNTYGCRAVITVRERSDTEQSRVKCDYTNIVASCEGIVTSCTVIDGTGMCDVGQAVQEGQVLISGYNDYGGVVTMGRAEGEIFASTSHEICGISPTQIQIRGENGKANTKISLCIGKKRINLYKGSGISAGSCVKMVTQYKLALPGGYVLPIMLIRETYVPYILLDARSESDRMEEMLSQGVQTYLRQEGVALSIVDTEESYTTNEDFVGLDGVYSCVEMIGREKAEQIGEIHGKTN